MICLNGLGVRLRISFEQWIKLTEEEEEDAPTGAAELALRVLPPASSPASESRESEPATEELESPCARRLPFQAELAFPAALCIYWLWSTAPAPVRGSPCSSSTDWKLTLLWLVRIALKREEVHDLGLVLGGGLGADAPPPLPPAPAPLPPPDPLAPQPLTESLDAAGAICGGSGGFDSETLVGDMGAAGEETAP